MCLVWPLVLESLEMDLNTRCNMAIGQLFESSMRSAAQYWRCTGSTWFCSHSPRQPKTWTTSADHMGVHCLVIILSIRVNNYSTMSNKLFFPPLHQICSPRVRRCWNERVGIVNLKFLRELKQTSLALQLILQSSLNVYHYSQRKVTKCVCLEKQSVYVCILECVCLHTALFYRNVLFQFKLWKNSLF